MLELVSNPDTRLAPTNATRVIAVRWLRHGVQDLEATRRKKACFKHCDMLVVNDLARRAPVLPLTR